MTGSRYAATAGQPSPNQSTPPGGSTRSLRPPHPPESSPCGPSPPKQRRRAFPERHRDGDAPRQPLPNRLAYLRRTDRKGTGHPVEDCFYKRAVPRPSLGGNLAKLREFPRRVIILSQLDSGLAVCGVRESALMSVHCPSRAARRPSSSGLWARKVLSSSGARYRNATSSSWLSSEPAAGCFVSRSLRPRRYPSSTCVSQDDRDPRRVDGALRDVVDPDDGLGIALADGASLRCWKRGGFPGRSP